MAFGLNLACSVLPVQQLQYAVASAADTEELGLLFEQVAGSSASLPVAGSSTQHCMHPAGCAHVLAGGGQ